MTQNLSQIITTKTNSRLRFRLPIMFNSTYQFNFREMGHDRAGSRIF